jgi:hypothetical protein
MYNIYCKHEKGWDGILSKKKTPQSFTDDFEGEKLLGRQKMSTKVHFMHFKRQKIKAVGMLTRGNNLCHRKCLVAIREAGELRAGLGAMRGAVFETWAKESAAMTTDVVAAAVAAEAQRRREAEAVPEAMRKAIQALTEELTGALQRKTRALVCPASLPFLHYSNPQQAVFF